MSHSTRLKFHQNRASLTRTLSHSFFTDIYNKIALMTYKQSRQSGICPTPQRALPAQDSSITGFSVWRTQKYNLPKIRWVDPVKVKKGNREDLVVIMRKVADHVALSPRSSSDNGPKISSWLSGTRKTSCDRKAQRWTHRNRRSAGAYCSSLLSCSIRRFLVTQFT